MRWLSRVISVVVIVVVVTAIALVIRSRMPATHVGQHFRVWALFRDGSRLAVGSPVMIAGVRVGEVTSLEVADGMARVDMKLRDDTDVPVDSWITKKAESAFGDSYLEIIPDTHDRFGARAYWDPAARVVGATSDLPAAVEIWRPEIDMAPDDIALGHDDVLYVALNGSVVLHDLRGRWRDVTLSTDGFQAWRLAADPAGGVWVLDRATQRLAAIGRRPNSAAVVLPPTAARNPSSLRRDIAFARRGRCRKTDGADSRNWSPSPVRAWPRLSCQAPWR